MLRFLIGVAQFISLTSPFISSNCHQHFCYDLLNDVRPCVVFINYGDRLFSFVYLRSTFKAFHYDFCANQYYIYVNLFLLSGFNSKPNANHLGHAPPSDLLLDSE